MVERRVFDEQLNKLLDDAQNLVQYENVDGIPYVSADHDWYRYELDLWQKGEQIRHLLMNSKKSPSEEQIHQILKICLNQKGGKGRQSFVLMLGKKQFANYSPIIAPLLEDSDVDGHVIDTLYKMGAADYVIQIQTLMNHDKTWIRNGARKYVLKYGK